jgi:hypothetical protein
MTTTATSTPPASGRVQLLCQRARTDAALIGNDNRVISGTLSNFCCGATAREAFWRGFAVIFGSDINATDDEMHEAELRV